MKRTMSIAVLLATAACRDDASPQADLNAEASAGNAASPAPAAPNAAAAPARSSMFTPAGDKNCKTIASNEETGDWTGACPGVAGYKVELSSGDLRDDITLIKDGKRTSLNLPALVSNGAFDTVGERIEWRGPAGGAPDVLVVRVYVADQNGRNDSGRLAVARLNPSPCLIGVVSPKPGQSGEARALADRVPLPSCLKAS